MPRRKLICRVGHPFTISHLAKSLVHISQLEKVSRPAVEAIRVVAFLLQDHAASELATLVLDQIKMTAAKVSNHVITVISPHVANILHSAELLHNNIDKINHTEKTIIDSLTPAALEAFVGRAEEAADAIFSGINNVKNTIELLTPSLDSTQNCINSVFTKEMLLLVISPSFHVFRSL
ncbi:hypothetical protein V8E55_007200 [Tylopilus felleus]